MNIDEVREQLDLDLFFRPREKLADGVFDAIRHLIITQKIKGGERLDYKELGELLNVSRVPLREAVQRLNATGLLQISNNNGTFVTQLSHEDIKDICNLRMMLETSSLRDGIDNISDRELDELEDVFRKEADVQEKDPDYRTTEYIMDADDSFHNLLIKSANSRIFSRVYLQIEDFILMLRNMNRREYISSQEHINIIQAMRNHDVEKAVVLLEAHLNSVCERLLLNIE